MMRLKKWLKEFGPSMIITFIIAALVFLSQLPYFVGVISFVFVDCVIGYWYRNKIMCDKAGLKAQVCHMSKENEKKHFNSDYYDLYHDFHYNRLMLMLKAICLAFSLCPILSNLIGDTISYFGIGITLAIVFWGIAIIASTLGKRGKVFMRLHSERKKNWFGEYTDEELEILRQLGDYVNPIEK